jgi:hypothetical protein
MRKSYTEADKLAAVFLAQQAGPEAAATALGIDPRSVRDWSKSITLPDDQWTAIRDVLIARGSVMAAKGTTTGLAATLTGAGIAERNVRYGQLIARRERRKAEEDKPPEPNPIRVQLDRLDVPRGRLMRDEIDALALRRELGLDDCPESESSDEAHAEIVTAWVDDLLGMTDAQVAQRAVALEAEYRELNRLRLERDEEEYRARLPRGFDTAVNVTPEQAAMVREAELLLESSQ